MSDGTWVRVGVRLRGHVWGVGWISTLSSVTMTVSVVLIVSARCGTALNNAIDREVGYLC